MIGKGGDAKARLDAHLKALLLQKYLILYLRLYYLGLHHGLIWFETGQDDYKLVTGISDSECWFFNSRLNDFGYFFDGALPDRGVSRNLLQR